MTMGAFASSAEISVETSAGSEYTFEILSNNTSTACLFSFYNSGGGIDVLVDYYGHVFGIDRESRTRSINTRASSCK